MDDIIVKDKGIKNMIYVIRRQYVMLDSEINVT